MPQINYLKVNEELFDQLERLGDKSLSGEALKAERTRSRMLCFKTQIQLLGTENMMLLQKIKDESPMLLSRHPDIEEWFQAHGRGLENLLRDLERSDEEWSQAHDRALESLLLDLEQSDTLPTA